MYRHHGQEWQKGACKHHAEHIAKIGTGSHLYILIDITKCLSTFKYAVFQYHQILLQQDDIRTFFCYIYRRIDRYANI